MATKRFKTVLVKDDDTSGCGIELPFNPKVVFWRVRAPVKVTINGFTFRTTTCSMGGVYWIPVNKTNREGAAINGGDRIMVNLEPDTDPRVVIPPPDFARALRSTPSAEKAWEKLSYTHQKEHVQAIEEAKKPETRQRRIANAIDRLTRTNGL